MANKAQQWQQGRNEGMDYALRIVEKDGVEALREEIKKRGITGISINCSHKELEKATEKMRNMMFDTFMCFTLGILHDEFGIGPEKAQRFMDKFMEGAKLLEEGAIEWDGIIERTSEILGKNMSIRKNDTNTIIKREY